MIVDDEEFCITFMKELAKKAGLDTQYQVDFCINGREAFERVVCYTKLGYGYKIIFTDFSMPVMDGIQSSEKIKKFLEQGNH